MKRSPRFYRAPQSGTTPSAPLELSIDGLSHDARGLSRHEGKRVFVAGALPGERVKARVSTQNSRFIEATTLKVLERSPERVEPRCPHYRECGGCTLQHLKSPLQPATKQEQVLDQLQRFSQITPDQVLAPLTGVPWGYRRRARLSVRYDSRSRQLRMGFREAKGSRITDISHCPVLDPRAEALLAPLRACLLQLKNPRAIGHLELAFGDSSGLLLIRATAPLSDAALLPFQELVRAHKLALFLQSETAREPQCLWPREGEAALTYQVPPAGLTLAFTPRDFTQVNADINRQMITQALTLLDPRPEERILDLFCGLGNFTLPLASLAKEVVGVEAQEGMVQRGRQNAARNGLGNVQFHAADLSADCSNEPWFGRGFDKILLDPPRAGALEVVQQLHRYRASRILYISCNPATLARDAAALKEQGYRLAQLGTLDMFPHTHHVEAMALFLPENA